MLSVFEWMFVMKYEMIEGRVELVWSATGARSYGHGGGLRLADILSRAVYIPEPF